MAGKSLKYRQYIQDDRANLKQGWVTLEPVGSFNLKHWLCTLFHFGTWGRGDAYHSGEAQRSLRRPTQGDMVQKPHRTEHGNALTEQRMAGLED